MKDLLTKKFQEPDFSDCFLIDLEYSQSKVSYPSRLQQRSTGRPLVGKVGNKLEVFIDSDRGFGFDKCKKISRYLETYFDQNGTLGEKYILEVSSPGLSRPLKVRRQYVKNIGRNARIELNDGSRIEGKIESVKDSELSLTIKNETRKIAMEMIKSTKILASFK